MLRNYISDLNPFNLAGPPKWWLRRLWDFDSSLVMIPSRCNQIYRLGQRRPPDPRVEMVNEILGGIQMSRC